MGLYIIVILIEILPNVILITNKTKPKHKRNHPKDHQQASMRKGESGLRRTPPPPPRGDPGVYENVSSISPATKWGGFSE